MEFKFNYTNKPQSSSSFGFFAKVVVMSISILIAAYLLPGVTITSAISAIIAALVIALLNNFLRPILIVLTLPFTIVSLGLFLLVINAIIILIADAIVPGIEIDGFWWALLLSIFITIVSYLLDIPAKMINRRQMMEKKEDSEVLDENTKFDDYEEVKDEDSK